MELPINDKELAVIVSALSLGDDVALYEKLNKIKWWMWNEDRLHLIQQHFFDITKILEIAEEK